MKLVTTLLLTLTLAFAIGCKTDEATTTEEATTAPGAVGTATCTSGCGDKCEMGKGADCMEACKEAGKCTGACKEGAKAPSPAAMGEGCTKSCGEKAPSPAAMGDGCTKSCGK